MAYLDDNYVVSGPDRVEDVHAALEEELFRHCHIRVHAGKTRVWNAGGIRPDACNELWRGSDVPTNQQGVKILGTPLGHADYVQVELESVAMDHQVLLHKIPGVPDVQSAWLLLVHCAQARANFMLRMIPPEAVREFAQRHDRELFQCLGQILDQDLSHCGRRGAGDSRTPSGPGRIKLAQCGTSACPSILGELGRLPSDDRRKASLRGHGV